MPTGWRVASKNERPGGRGKTKTMGTTVKIEATYEISEAARTALALAGTPVNRYQTVELELDASDAIKRKLAQVSDSGIIYQRTGVGTIAGYSYGKLWPLSCGAEYTGCNVFWTTDHVLTVEEAMARHEQAAAATRLLAELAREKEESFKREYKERIDRVVGMMATIPASEWALHTTYGKTPYLREVTPNPGPDHVSALADELPTEARASAEIELCRRQKAEADAKAAEAAAVIAERDAWILAHGSTRLQKGFAAGLVDKMGGVYRDERIFHDVGPDWIAWKDAPEPDDNDLLNPSEAELDALAEVAKKFPVARLASVGGTSRDGDEHDWRPALMIGSCPWNDELTVIKYLD
jgi:hypothetical protein